MLGLSPFLGLIGKVGKGLSHDIVSGETRVSTIFLLAIVKSLATKSLPTVSWALIYLQVFGRCEVSDLEDELGGLP